MLESRSRYVSLVVFLSSVLRMVTDALPAFASQLVDDLLDFTASAAELGKPGQGADLKLGLATAPALYAWEEFPELGAMIERKFAHEDDVERVRAVFPLSPFPSPIDKMFFLLCCRHGISSPSRRGQNEQRLSQRNTQRRRGWRSRDYQRARRGTH